MATSPADITVAPAADQHIQHEGKDYTTVKEGLAYILVPRSAPKVPQTVPHGETASQSVFYNPIQQFNRDLSVLAIKAFGEETLEKKKLAAQSKFDNARKNKKRKRGKEDHLENGAAKVSNPEAKSISWNVGADAMVEDKRTTTVESGKFGEIEVPHLEESISSDAQAPKDGVEDLNMLDAEHDIKSTEETVQGPRPPPFTILDALSATGLRAVRYAQEIPFATSITANDLLPAATASIKLNVKHNKLEDKITAITGNALAHMYTLAVEPERLKTRSKKYDVIDLDPYGTAAPFLDAAVQSVQDGGLLCVTCTDAGVWASNGYPEKAFALYGGTTIKGMHSHEGGLRLILHAISTSAARYGLAVEPLLSLSIDFYARVFVKVRKSPADVKFLAGKTMIVHNCDSGCGAWTTQLLAKNRIQKNKSGNGTFYKHTYSQSASIGDHCEHCGMKTHSAGPMYAGPLHSPAFIQRILEDLPHVSKDTYKTTDRIEGMLSMALEETLEPLEEESALESPIAKKDGRYDPATVDHFPFFFIPSVLSKVIHCVTPHEHALRGAIRHLGYRVTRSHTKAGSIKTDAPWSVIWQIMREWARQKAPIREGAIREGTAGWTIMKMGTTTDANGKKGDDTDLAEREVVFDEALGKEKDKKKLVRFQRNPRENWGPMNRARGH